ncbi:MAG TPA: trypsin-like peptidase domain-containing protein [Solirubrobacteraceae bacterium]|nr:trypsin-like peptidase domain-containing protein [Solirubrobacteraceae bacterium]
MDRLWTDGPPTRTMTPPPPPRPPFAQEPPPPPPPPSRGPSRWLAAAGGGTVSAVVVAAVLLGSGVVDDDSPANAPATTPVSVAPSGSGNGDVARSVYAAASSSVVSIRTGSGSGTGFLVDGDGTIVTNAHVVGDASQVQVRFEDDGELHTAQVLGVDASTDLAAIKVEASAADGVKPLALADSEKVQVGEEAVAIGYPLGLDRTATAGIVSGLNRDIQAPNGFSIDEVIQTDAPINPGNSGGPLLNAGGQVIGVNSQIASAAAGGGIGFAVPANTVRDVLPQLERGAAPEHAYLGLSTAPAENGDGAQVAEATAGGPAAKAGIQAGDVVVEVDSATVSTPDDVAQAIDDNKPGDRVEVKVQRGGSEQTIDVTLGQRPEQLPSQPQTTP